MISLLLFLLAQAGTADGVPDRVMLCMLRTATLSDSSDRGKLVPEGPDRLLGFRLKGPADGRIEGAAVEMHDPTGLMLGREIAYVAQQGGNTAFATSGKKNDLLALAVSPAAAGAASGRAYLTRMKNGRPTEFAVGGCAFLPTTDPAGTFEIVRSQPGARE